MDYFVYILRSSRDGKLYIGFTKNVGERLKRHNSGKVFSTKHRVPLNLVYYEKLPSLKKALMREKYLKGLKRDRLNKLVLNMASVAQPG